MKASGLFAKKTNKEAKERSKKDIIEFDHNFDARIVSCSSGTVPEPETKVSGKRPCSILFKKHQFELSEPDGIRERHLTTWQYIDITAVAWDHQHSSFKVTNANAKTSTYSVTIGQTEGPLGLNLVNTKSTGPGKGKSAAVDSVSGAAAESGQMKPGHLIVNVNGQSTSGLTFNDTMSVLQAASRPITLELSEVDAISASGGDKGIYLILEVDNSTEIEQELSVRIEAERTSQGSSTPAPSIQYMGIFAGKEKPKPFQRKRASLVKAPTERLPTPQVMRRLSMQTTRERAKGARSGLALQHIHKGYNSFEVSLQGGMRRHMVINYNNISVVDDPNRLHSPQLVIDFERIRSYRVQGETAKLEIGDEHGSGTTFQSFGCKEPLHLVQTVEYFLNQDRVRRGLDVVPGSTHGRNVQVVHTLTGQVNASDTLSAQLKQTMAEKVANEMAPTRSRRSSIGGVKPDWWKQVVAMSGWMLKKGGMTKSWQRRFFILYNTSQGHILCYYASYEDTPIHSINEYKERKWLECCMITQIRPVSKMADAPEFGFDVVAVDREWTFGAETKEEMQVWLQLLSRAVDEDVAITPDDVLNFPVKPVIDPSGTLPKYDYTTLLKVQSQGIQVCTGPEFTRQSFFWCYTDIHRWSVATHNNKPCLLMSVFLSDKFTSTQDFVFRTKESAKLSSSIEFYIEKFMSIMQLRCPDNESAADPNYWHVPVGDGSSAAAGAEDDDAGDDYEDYDAAEDVAETPAPAPAPAPVVDLLDMDAPMSATDVRTFDAASSGPMSAADAFGAPPAAPPAGAADPFAPVQPSAAAPVDPFAPSVSAPSPAAPAAVDPFGGGAAFNPFDAPAPATAADPFAAAAVDPFAAAPAPAPAANDPFASYGS